MTEYSRQSLAVSNPTGTQMALLSPDRAAYAEQVTQNSLGLRSPSNLTNRCQLHRFWALNRYQPGTEGGRRERKLILQVPVLGIRNKTLQNGITFHAVWSLTTNFPDLRNAASVNDSPNLSCKHC